MGGSWFMPGTEMRTINGILSSISKIAPTPQQAVNALAALKTIDWVNRGPGGNTVSQALLEANIQGAYDIATNTANEFFQPNSVKRQELIMLITQVGVVKVVVALLQMIVRELS